MFWKLASKSLLYRKQSVSLTILAISISLMLLLGLTHIRNNLQSSFNQTVSDVDLIVGARTGDINLLLYSVFRIGQPTNNISWQSVEDIQNNPQVDWLIPLSLGDSHRGFRVIGTDSGYFKYLKFGQKQPLTFQSGQAFDSLFDVVIGATVAKKLGYQLGDKLTLNHGISQATLTEHKNTPFTVVGILNTTGTPIDQSLHVSLEAIEAIHIGWQQGIPPIAGQKKIPALDQNISKLKPKAITAAMVGLHSKVATFRVQREISQYEGEPLMAILPGVTLSQLWSNLSMVENTLDLVSALVLIAALLGLCAMLLASIREREPEIQILRSMGAGPIRLFGLIQGEAVLMMAISISLAVAGLWALTSLAAASVSNHFGVALEAFELSTPIIQRLGLFLAAGFGVSSLPSLWIAWQGVRK
jgi:putative ABC transport system permease protein